MVIQILADLFRTVKSWWKRDRIRVSPSEGRLLRIQSGDLLTYGEIQAEVLSRTVIERQDGNSLRWECRHGSGLARLTIELDITGNPLNMTWCETTGCHQIDAEHLRVWAKDGLRPIRTPVCNRPTGASNG